MQKTEKQFHLHCMPEDIGRYCILPGDPGRVPAIAGLFDDARPVAQNREFNIWTGMLMGEKVTACSTGIGGLRRPLPWKSFTTAERIPLSGQVPAEELIWT